MDTPTPSASPSDVQETNSQETPIERRMDTQEQADSHESQKEAQQAGQAEGREGSQESSPVVSNPALIKPKSFSSLASISNTRPADIQAQRARLEALRERFKTRASQRMLVQSREAPTGEDETSTPDNIDVAKIMDAVGKDLKKGENIGGFIEDDPDSPRRIDKYESEAEFQSKLIDTEQTKDSRIRKLLRKRVQQQPGTAQGDEMTSASSS